MKFVERLCDALYAFRHGLTPPEPEPRTVPGPWFDSATRHVSHPAERRYGNAAGLQIGSSLPDHIALSREPMQRID